MAENGKTTNCQLQLKMMIDDDDNDDNDEDWECLSSYGDVIQAWATCCTILRAGTCYI